jgi:hypothetical protein
VRCGVETRGPETHIHFSPIGAELVISLSLIFHVPLLKKWLFYAARPDLMSKYMKIFISTAAISELIS